MKTVAFILTMPNVGSWDGKWSGEGNLYAIVKRITEKRFSTLMASYYYRWPDGWGARIAIREIDGKEARQIRKNSKGFCGYDWMVTSILTSGEIKTQ